MTVFIAFAEADRAEAEGLDRFLERRGHFTELDDGETVLREVEPADTVVALISANFGEAPVRLRLEQRALDAWSEGRLVLVRLDGAYAPVGLRDLHYIDAASDREVAWGDVHEAISAAPPPTEGARAEIDSAPAPARKRTAAAAPRAARKGGGLLWVLAILVMLPGIVAFAATLSIWLVNRIGPTPGSLDDLIYGIDELGVHYGAPIGATPLIFAVLMLLTLLTAAAGLVALFTRRPQAEAAPVEEVEAPAAPSPSLASARASFGAAARSDLFVSYARANALEITPVLDAARQSGRSVWLDQEGLMAGDGWAGEIVRAIKGANHVMVMCSRAAFESDHVKREVYLADRYKKRLLPIFIEEAEPPEDFEYFFAGVQWLKLHETPEAERPAAVLRVLESA